MKFRATVAYDGSGFFGFQVQAGVRTVQGELERALNEIAGEQPAPAKAGVIGAGRTDTGVHATGQVVAFSLEWRHPLIELARAVNHRLPADVAILDVAECPDDFHPRFSARSRTYEYSVVIAEAHPLLSRYAWLVSRMPDLAALQAAAERIVGDADFAAFGSAPVGEVTRRQVLRSEWRRETAHAGLGSWPALRYTIEANAFLYRMVRRVVKTLMRAGNGELTAGEVSEILKSGDPQRVKGLAPAAGLCLVEVKY